MRSLAVPVLLATVAMAAGCSTRSAATSPGSEAVAPEGAAPNTPPAGIMALEDTTVCIVDRSSSIGLATMPAKRIVATGEVVVLDGGSMRPLAEVHRASLENGYAQEQDWFGEDAPIRYSGAEYLKYSMQRLIGPGEMKRGGEVLGVPVFLHPREGSPPEVLYLSVEPGCIFQPYLRADRVRQIRGE